MAGFLGEDQVRQVKDATDLVQLIAEYVPVQRVVRFMVNVHHRFRFIPMLRNTIIAMGVARMVTLFTLFALKKTLNSLMR